MQEDDEDDHAHVSFADEVSEQEAEFRIVWNERKLISLSKSFFGFHSRTVYICYIFVMYLLCIFYFVFVIFKTSDSLLIHIQNNLCLTRLTSYSSLQLSSV